MSAQPATHEPDSVGIINAGAPTWRLVDELLTEQEAALRAAFEFDLAMARREWELELDRRRLSVLANRGWSVYLSLGGEELGFDDWARIAAGWAA